MMLAAGAFVPYATSRGYTLVVYDVRGQNASEGSIDLHVNLKNDGYDVVEWVGRPAVEQRSCRRRRRVV